MTEYKNDTQRLLRSQRGSLCCYWGIAIVMAVLYSVQSYLSPLCLDDWGFMGVWRDDIAADGFSFAAWRDYFNYIRGFDNGRIANALSPFSTLFSPWKELFPVATGVFLTLSAVLLQRFAAEGRYRPSALILTWALMIVFLPWNDTIFARDYSLNYIWAAAITLVFLFFLKRACRNRRWLLPALFMAIIAGGWHEGFAVPTLFGLGCLMLVRRFRLPVSVYIITAVYLGATLLFMLSPGLINRFYTSVSGPASHYLLKRPLLIIVADILLMGVLAVAHIWRRRPLKKLFKELCSVPLIVSAGILISGYALGFLTVNTFRSFFWPDMAAICIALILLRNILRLLPVKALYLRTGAAALLVLCVLQAISAIVWQKRYRQETDEIMALLDESATGTVFYDIRMPEKPPFYTFGMPVSAIWFNHYHYSLLWSYYMTPVIGVVPTSQRNAASSEWEPDTVGMIAPDYIRGRLVVPFISERGDTLFYTYPQK